MVLDHAGARSGRLAENTARLATSPAIDVRTLNRYLDLLVDAGAPPSTLVRKRAKRLVRSPKIYVRDCGLVHALLGLGSPVDVLGHPVAGASRETLVIEGILSVAPDWVQPWFYLWKAPDAL